MSLLTKTWEAVKQLWPWGRKQITVLPPEEIVFVPIEPEPIRVVIEFAPQAPQAPQFGPLAVDTKLKRMSAINVGCPWRALLPDPDGTVGQPDRQVVPFLYSGITADPPDPTVPIVASDLWHFRLMAYGSC